MAAPNGQVPFVVPASSGGSKIILGVLGAFAVATLVVVVWLVLSGRLNSVKRNLSKLSSDNLYHSHKHHGQHGHGNNDGDSDQNSDSDGDSDSDSDSDGDRDRDHGDDKEFHSPSKDHYDLEDSKRSKRREPEKSKEKDEKEGIEGAAGKATTSREADLYLTKLVQKIMDAPKADKLKVTASVIAELLQIEDSKTVANALSTVVSPASPKVVDSQKALNEKLTQLADLIKKGDLNAIRESLRSPTDKTLSDLYDSIISSLEKSPTVSDDVRKTLGQIKVIKCQMKFKDDPTGMVTCMTELLPTNLSPSSIPQTGTPGSSQGPGTPPAPGASQGPGTTPAPGPVPAVNTNITVRNDGLVQNTNAGQLTFTFDRDRLKVCNSSGVCKSNVLI